MYGVGGGTVEPGPSWLGQGCLAALAATTGRFRSEASISAVVTGRGMVHSPCCRVGTRTEKTSPAAFTCTIACATPFSLGETEITRVHSPSVPHWLRRAYTPGREVRSNSSFTDLRCPFTIPSAVPLTGNATG